MPQKQPMAPIFHRHSTKAQNNLANLGKNGPTETALDFAAILSQAPTPEQNPAYGMDIGAAAQQQRNGSEVNLRNWRNHSPFRDGDVMLLSSTVCIFAYMGMVCTFISTHIYNHIYLSHSVSLSPTPSQILNSVCKRISRRINMNQHVRHCGYRKSDHTYHVCRRSEPMIPE